MLGRQILGHLTAVIHKLPRLTKLLERMRLAIQGRDLPSRALSTGASHTAIDDIVHVVADGKTNMGRATIEVTTDMENPFRISNVVVD